MNGMAADIGAANGRLAWQSGDNVLTDYYPNAGFSDLYQVKEQFLQVKGGRRVKILLMALAFPGPPNVEFMHLTDIDWIAERSGCATGDDLFSRSAGAVCGQPRAAVQSCRGHLPLRWRNRVPGALDRDRVHDLLPGPGAYAGVA